MRWLCRLLGPMFHVFIFYIVEYFIEKCFDSFCFYHSFFISLWRFFIFFYSLNLVAMENGEWGMACIRLDYFYQVCYPQWFSSMRIYTMYILYECAFGIFPMLNICWRTSRHMNILIYHRHRHHSLQFKHSKNQQEITVSANLCVYFRVAMLCNGKFYFPIVQIAQHMLGKNIKKMKTTLLTGRRKMEHHKKDDRQTKKCIKFLQMN